MGAAQAGIKMGIPEGVSTHGCCWAEFGVGMLEVMSTHGCCSGWVWGGNPRGCEHPWVPLGQIRVPPPRGAPIPPPGSHLLSAGLWAVFGARLFL